MAKTPVQPSAAPQTVSTPTPEPAIAPASSQPPRVALEVNDADIEAIALYAANMNPDQKRRVSQMVATVAPELAGPKKMPNGWMEFTIQIDPDILVKLEAFADADGSTLTDKTQEMVGYALSAYFGNLEQAHYVDQTPAK